MFSILVCILFPANNKIENEELKETIVDKEIIEEPKEEPVIETEPVVEEEKEEIKGVAKISIPNTDFNEDVYQAKNNDYYLTHNSKGKYSRNGEIFLDYRVNLDKSQINLIYGHSAPYKLPSNIMENYLPMGYKYFKLCGRNNLPKRKINWIRYIIKPEYHDDILYKIYPINMVMLPLQ